MGFQKVGFFQGSAGSPLSVLGLIADSEYVDCMGYNGTSTLYANFSGPRICTIRPTAAWSTSAVSLNPGFLEVDEVFLEVSLPVDDVGSGTRTLH